MHPLAPGCRRKGGVLITVLIVLFIAGAMAAIAINYSLFTLKSSYRSIARSQAMAIGEGELEAMFYKWRLALLNGLSQNEALDFFANTSGTAANRVWDNATTPTTLKTSTLLAQEQTGWTIKRSMHFEREDIGIVPGSVPKFGKIAYYTAKIELSSPAPNPITLKIGRTFAVSDASIYQFSILYQNELECNPATAMEVAGQVMCNSDIYVGGTVGSIVNFLDKVHYVSTFNGMDYVTLETQLRTSMSLNPSGGVPLTPPTFTLGYNSALNRMTAAENFVGGVNAATAVDQFPSAYASTEDVYRALIEPPPAAPEHPAISERRMYNRALRPTANKGSGLFINITGAGATVSYTDLGSSNVTDVTSIFNNAITPRQPMVDPRENQNDPTKGAKQVTDINVGTLIAQIAGSSLYPHFNGIIYIQENLPAQTAIRLKNCASLYPNNDNGITFVTNTGMYIQGNYNTTNRHNSGSVNTQGAGTDTIPSALMADAITVLSSNWDDARSSDPLASRFANADSIICAALVTGNVGSIPTADPVVKSGGVQNLIRLVENWGNNQTLFFGTLAQLFRSKYYIAPCPNVGADVGVYTNPSRRTLQYNSTLSIEPPNRNPSTTIYSRGSFFFW